MRPRILVPLALTLIVGCAVGPDYERPTDLAPAEFRAPETTTEKIDDTGFAEIPWWEVFHDPTLQALIRTALENNQDLLAATARVEEMRAMVGVASAGLFPQVTASGTASRTGTPSAMLTPVTPPEIDYFSVFLDLSYELDLWGRIRKTRDAARAQLVASEEDRQTVVSTLITEVARTYFGLLELDREVQITTATLETRQSTLKLMELRREHGTASDLEVNRFRAEVAATLAALAALEQQVFQTENALSVLLGQPPQGIARDLQFGELPPIPDVPAGLPSDLLERRPDLKSAEQQLVAATARIGVAKAAFFPRIALTGQRGFRSSELDSLINAHNIGYMIAGNITEPIFDAGRNWFNLQATKAQQEQALQYYRRTVLQALREVSDALIAKQQTNVQRGELEDQVDALRESVRLSDLRYRVGQSSYLEFLDAERQLYAAELQLERARLEELLASVRLYKALGGGVVIPEYDAVNSANTTP